MDGVLEATITLYGCKVLCSLLCLPAFKGSTSCVSLCCSCLLLFTDVTITMFLLYLWSAVPRPMFFHSSSDIIALRFMLFLSNTYEAVLMLTPLLVMVEVLVRLLWSGETTPSVTAGNGVKQDKGSCVGFLTGADGDASQFEPQHGEEHSESGRDTLKALGFLGCLLLWGICGTYAMLSWRKEQGMVSSCLEGGGLLSACLPCLLTTSSPIHGQLFWALPVAGLLLALSAMLNAKLVPKFARDGKLTSADVPYAIQLGQTQQPALDRTAILGKIQGADSNGPDGGCNVYSSQIGYKKQHWAHGEPEALAWSREACKLKSQSFTFILPQQTPYPHKSRIWEAQWESPSLRVELMMGLLCGLLVCIFPTVLSTNVLLVSNLDALALYVLKHLLTPAYDN